MPLRLNRERPGALSGWCSAEEAAMGLWDFVRDAGKAIGIGAASAEEAPAPDAGALKKEIDDLGLEAEGLDIEVAGDTVKVSGKAPSQEDKEKVILALGNTLGVAKVDEAIEAPEAGARPVFHTVVKGDTLWAIAEKTLGSGDRYQEIFEANRPMLKDPDEIYPGQVLRVPK
jgi:nucleoid-associated protein YgaU